MPVGACGLITVVVNIQRRHRYLDAHLRFRLAHFS